MASVTKGNKPAPRHQSFTREPAPASALKLSSIAAPSKEPTKKPESPLKMFDGGRQLE